MSGLSSDSKRGESKAVPIMSRGAQLLLTAMQNLRRPGECQAATSTTSVQVPNSSLVETVPTSIFPATTSPEKLPAVSSARAAILQMVHKSRQVGDGGEVVQQQSSALTTDLSSDSSCAVSPAPSGSSSLGRGMVARLRTLGFNPEASTHPLSREPLLPASSSLIQKEKQPVVKMGESGTKIPIIANYIRMNTDPEKGIFEYEVRFDPPVDSKAMRFRLLNQHQEAIGTAKTFDGVTLYLPFQFEKNITCFESTQPVTNEVILMKVIFRQKRNSSDCVHFYNVLIKRIFRILGMVQMKRSYFNPNSPIVLPAEEPQLLKGLTAAVTVFEGGIMLCIDVSFRVLRTTTVLDELAEMSKKGSQFQKTATDTFVGLSILTRYNNKMYRIDEILFDKNPMSTFAYQGNPITFVDYYKNHYDIEIKDKGQPLLLSRAEKKCHGREDETRLICLIPELSYLTGLDDRLRSNTKFMRILTGHTRLSPVDRNRELENYVNLVNSNEKASSVLSEWGITLEPNCLRIEGRELPPEQIILSKSKFFPNAKLDWTSNLKKDVLAPVNIQSWILVCTDRDHPKTKEYSQTLIDVSSEMGIHIASPKIMSLPNDRTNTYLECIREEINSQLQLVVCVFPASRTDRYSAVKSLCSTQFAVPSQCINSKTINNRANARSAAQKIALQINCKTGGELWAVDIPTKTMMVCGIDVYHDPGRRGPSVVGFVASTNATMTRWYSRAKFQEKGVEMVDTIKICLIESLKKYYETNHDYPKQIVMFRDGVSDGQLSFCADHEVPQFLSAFQSVVPPIEPKFTMVVVQKRINARFFRVTPTGLTNLTPGTVIDHTVTERDWWDYFLVSQHVNQGTVTPTHFVVVHDGGMKPDHLQRLTYKMTMLYYNWYGPVRVPAPCLYAHKLATLVGEFLRKEVKEELCNRLHFL